MLDSLLTQILADLDPAVLKRDVAALWQLARPADFDSFTAEAAWFATQARAFGLTSETWQLPADGETAFHTYCAPMGYRTRTATVDILEPLALRGRIADRAVTPNTAITGTGHTGPEGVTAELVLITDPAQFTAIPVAGKIVLCPNLHVMSLRQLCVAHGAVALLSSFNKYADSVNRDAVKWNNTWDNVDDGWLPTGQAAAENLPGLVITPAQGEVLAQRLRAGERVVAKIMVDGEYFSGTFPVATAFTPGRTADELWLTGHLFEQGAWDNASGVIASLHAGRLLAQSVARRGSTPRRGLRHVHTQECHGVLALHALHPERLAHVKACVCIDGVGIQEVPVHVKPGLRASGDFTLRLLRECLRLAATQLGTAWRENESFEINCSLLADPRTGTIPSAMLGPGNEMPTIWHTDRDTPAVLDDAQLLLATATTAAWSLFLAEADSAAMRWVLAQYPRWIADDLAAGRLRDGAAYLELLRRELRTIPEYADSAADASELRTRMAVLLAATQRDLANAPRFTPEGTPAELERTTRLFPNARWSGPALDSFFTPAALARVGSPKWDPPQVVLATWCDGTRSLLECLQLTAQETGETARLTLPWALAWVNGLAETGHLELGAR